MFAESCIWQINSCPYAICGLLGLWCDFHYDTLHSRTHSHWLKSINACTLEEIMTWVNLKIINNGDMFICWEDYWEQILALVLRALRALAKWQLCLFTFRVTTLPVLMKHLFKLHNLISINVSNASLIEKFWCKIVFEKVSVIKF